MFSVQLYITKTQLDLSRAIEHGYKVLLIFVGGGGVCFNILVNSMVMSRRSADPSTFSMGKLRLRG